jgi:RNA polymerase sigma-70 factor, Bacteroides expansion family 1
MNDFDSIYQRWYKKSFAFAKSYLHDSMAAEDIVSESIIKLWKSMSESNIEHPDALLFTILRNKTLDYLKHESIRKNAEKEMSETLNRELALRISTLEACDPDEIFSAELTNKIEEVLTLLPPKTREIFELSRFEGLSAKAIAEKKGLSVKSVEYHITQALKKLRSELKDFLPLFVFAFLFH